MGIVKAGKRFILNAIQAIKLGNLADAENEDEAVTKRQLDRVISSIPAPTTDTNFANTNLTVSQTREHSIESGLSFVHKLGNASPIVFDTIESNTSILFFNVKASGVGAVQQIIAAYASGDLYLGGQSTTGNVYCRKGLTINGFQSQHFDNFRINNSNGDRAVSVRGDNTLRMVTPSAITSTAPGASFLMYSQDISANVGAPHFMIGNGDVVKLFKGAALTAPDGTLANAVIRIAELEARLQAAGLLT